MPFGVYLIAVPIGLLALAFVPDIEHVAAKREGSVLAVFRENTVLFGIYTFMLLTNLLLYAIVVYLPEIIKGAGITNTFQVGLFFAGMGIAGGLSATQYGRVRERASYSRIVSLVFLLWSVGFALAYFWHSVWAFVLLVVLFGTGQGLALPAVMLWVGDVVRPSFHGRFSSYITTTGYLGQFLSPIAFAPVVSRLGVGHVYLAALFVGLGGLAFSLVFVKKGTGSREISSEGP
jgi:predicted MFS family arabinose efflux permease